MPRGKATSIDDKIAAQKNVIEKLQEKLDAANAELKNLYDQKEAEKRKIIYDAIDGSSKSMDEILAFLKENKEA